MPVVVLRRFAAPDLSFFLRCGAHRDQRVFAHDLPARELELLQTMPGTEYRGARVLARHAWVADDETGVPVGLLGAEIYDRAPFLDSEGQPRRPVPTWQGPVAALMLCVDPARWGRGYGRAALLAVAASDELTGVEWLEAPIESRHLASQRCAAAAGFIPSSPQPDQEGMVSWLRAPLR